MRVEASDTRKDYMQNPAGKSRAEAANSSKVGAKSENGKVKKESAAATVTLSSTATKPNPESESTPSLLQSFLQKAKKLWERIWGDTKEVSGETAEAAKTAGVLKTAEPPKIAEASKTEMAETAELSEAAGKATSKVETKRAEESAPYFIVCEEKVKNPTLLERFRMQVSTVTGHLAKRFHFTNTGSFEAKQQKNKQDLRKKSKYHDKGTEVDCVLTDDSYLMDSYDRKGTYQTLSTTNKTK